MKKTNMGLRSRKAAVLLIALVVCLCTSVGGTVAYIFVTTNSIGNTFTPTPITTQVTEELSGNVKSDVRIQNTGETTAWLRAAILFTWQDANGNVYGEQVVEGEDYAITLATEAEGWIKGNDGLYYWTSPVAPGASSGVLIKSCQQLDTALSISGYYLTVEIVGSGIQDRPAEAFNQWAAASGISIENGKLVK